MLVVVVDGVATLLSGADDEAEVTTGEVGRVLGAGPEDVAVAACST